MPAPGTTLEFELPDPSGRWMWQVHAARNGTEVRIRAHAGDRQRETRWFLSMPTVLWLRELGTGSDPGEEIGLLPGVAALYRRRFREVLASGESEYELGRAELAELHRPVDTSVLGLIAHEMEKLLFELADVRSRLDDAAASRRVDFSVPEPQLWVSYEPVLAASEDALTQRVYPQLSKFYEDYTELAKLLLTSWFERPVLSRALITRAELQGTLALWALDDARGGQASSDSDSHVAAWPRERAVHIRRIELQNIRRFHALSHAFHPPEQSDCGQWLIFLGDNGTGKTTLLRVIALALLDADIAQALVTQHSADVPLIRLHRPAGGAYPGRTDAKMSVALDDTGPEPYTLLLSPAQGRERLSVISPRAIRPPVFAYGCRRGNALGGPERELDVKPVDSVVTLFDPQAHLVYADAWLRKLAYAAEKSEPDRALFESVLSLFVDQAAGEDALLPGVHKIEVAADRTWVYGPGAEPVPLTALSDGYLTTLGWLVDFLARWLEYARRIGYEIHPGFHKEMPAVVLVDEIDLHLHPRWQTRIVRALARTFPRTTFIVTTHNPLTLNGTVLEPRMEAAVHVIQTTENGGLELVQRDLPPGLEADEVLTGDWFGLRSTLDRDTLAKMDKHRALLRAGTPPNDPERLRLEAELRRRLGSYADTPAERLAQELVARAFPQDDRPLSEEEREALHVQYAESVARARSQAKTP